MSNSPSHLNISGNNAAVAARELRSFKVKYAGLIPEIRCDIDPSGRTDLLKVLDVAENNGHITILGSNADFKEDAILEISADGIKMTSIDGKESLLLVPVNMIASVGYVKEEELHIVPLKIGINNETFDLAVIYTQTKDIALEICYQMSACFQSVYQESITSGGEASSRTTSFGRPTFTDVTSGAYIAGSVSTSTTNSSRRNEEMINEYITMISVCLTHSELNAFAILMKRWREGVIPILEFGKKLLEIYGPERKHLLARMKHLLIGISPEDMDQLNKFMIANGITENAANSATSPLMTAETNLTTDDGSLGCDNIRLALKRLSSNLPTEDEAAESISNLKMSNSASSARSSQGPFRSLFSKLRKQSDNGGISNLQVQVGSRVYDAQEIQKLIPQLEEGIEKKDKQLRQSQSIIEAHTKKIGELEKEVKTLSTECDKLRSVLQQTAESAASPATPNQKSSHTDDLHTDLQQKAVLPTTEPPETVRSKKMAVSAEPAKLDQHKGTLQHHTKTAGSKQLIRDAVQKNDFLRQLAKEQVIELVECMFEMRARAGQWVIQEGEPGDRLFVVAEGQLQVSREGTVLGNMGPGVVMGELAILYNCVRTASVQALSDVSLWVLDRSAFQMITMRLGMERHSQLMNFLNKVSIFENLSEDRISKMADVMDQDYYAGGHHIIREGEKGDTFFVINSGQVRVTQSIEGEHEPREIRILKQGDFFGEKALLGEEVRTANVIAMNPGVEVLTLDRESFLKLIGDLEALKRDYGDNQRRATLSARAAQEQPPSPTRIAQDNEYAQLQLRQLKRIATLGVGGFGRVELVCINGDKSRTFALKALKKKHIVDTRQQEHIFAERNIMMETKTDWIVRLYTTFRDSKYVYMLLEACLGGELWTTLRDRGHFDDYTARFFVACVLEGLEHLHRKNIVYRDLKPENCLLTQNGYLKLVDFGFAKKLASGRKTWTFCGTPEYVSPEIILNKGHDQAADYWALGIYICELMLGRPPFQASDPMKTYTLILKGIDALDIPNRRIGKTATALVKKLCRDNPGERLGSGSGGVNDIRKHRWFMGFDWEGLRTRALKAPIVPKVSNPADVSNFDNYPPDQDIPPDEFSGWDEGF